MGHRVTDDQQLAGVIMKLVGGGFLWVIITLRFFQWAGRFSDSDKAADQAGPPTDLTWADVEREFDRHPPAPEPKPRPARHRPDAGPDPAGRTPPPAVRHDGAVTRWAASDMPDQTGRTVVVTGANSGLGVASAEAFAGAAAVVLACRDARRAESRRQGGRAGHRPPRS